MSRSTLNGWNRFERAQTHRGYWVGGWLRRNGGSLQSIDPHKRDILRETPAQSSDALIDIQCRRQKCPAARSSGAKAG
jgi:hypothetical protein